MMPAFRGRILTVTVPARFVMYDVEMPAPRTSTSTRTGLPSTLARIRTVDVLPTLRKRGETVSLSHRIAGGRNGATTRVVAVDTLFAGFGSGSEPATDTVLTTRPTAFARTTAVIVTEAPLSIRPSSHRIGCAVEHEP